MDECVNVNCDLTTQQRFQLIKIANDTWNAEVRAQALALLAVPPVLMFPAVQENSYLQRKASAMSAEMSAYVEKLLQGEDQQWKLPSMHAVRSALHTDG